MFNAAIFDMDGLPIDSERAIMRACFRVIGTCWMKSTWIQVSPTPS